MLDLRELRDRAEGASPVEAIDVWFWITDLSGRAVVRFGGTDANAARLHHRAAEDVPVVELPGTVYETVLRSQQPDLRTDDAGGPARSRTCGVRPAGPVRPPRC